MHFVIVKRYQNANFKNVKIFINNFYFFIRFIVRILLCEEQSNIDCYILQLKSSTVEKIHLFRLL